jgi:type I restriction enzyme S subunit
MSELPRGWAEAEIGAICDLINGRAFKPTDWSKNGLPIVRIQNLNNPSADFNYCDFEIDERFEIDRDELLFAWSGTPGTSFGAHVWKGGRAVLNQHIFRVLFDRQVVERDFLKLAINVKLEELIGKAHGGVGLRHVTKGKFEETTVAIPPLPEQCRIVAKLDALDARAKRARADLDRIPALVARAKQAILEKAFQGELTTHWRANQTKEVPWQTRPLESLIDSGPSNGWSPPSSSDANGAFSLKLTATTSGELRLDDDAVKRIHENPPPDSKYWLMSGDLLIQRANTIEYVGTAAIFDGPEQTFIYPDLMMRVRVDDPILRKYLWRFINSTGAKKYFRDNATGTAGNMPKINGTTVRALAVPVAPAEERTEIVRRIESAFARIDRIAADAASASKLLTRLDQAILTKAFRGELVPQNPEDEPASILLERIRAKTKTAPRKGRGRKA